MTPKSTAERVQELRDRMRAAGFVLRQVWVHPGDWERVKAFIARLAAKRRRKSR
jgi:hypothetical protein